MSKHYRGALHDDAGKDDIDTLVTTLQWSDVGEQRLDTFRSQMLRLQHVHDYLNHQ